jgi:hypothetical protein
LNPSSIVRIFEVILSTISRSGIACRLTDSRLRGRDQSNSPHDSTDWIEHRSPRNCPRVENWESIPCKSSVVFWLTWRPCANRHRPIGDLDSPVMLQISLFSKTFCLRVVRVSLFVCNLPASGFSERGFVSSETMDRTLNSWQPALVHGRFIRVHNGDQAH